MNFGGKVLTDNRYGAYLVKGNGMHGIDRTISFKRQLSGDHFVQDDPWREQDLFIKPPGYPNSQIY